LQMSFKLCLRLILLLRDLVIHVSHLTFAWVFKRVMRSRPWS
jgi:hypothetical protein